MVNNVMPIMFLHGMTCGPWMGSFQTCAGVMDNIASYS